MTRFVPAALGAAALICASLLAAAPTLAQTVIPAPDAAYELQPEEEVIVRRSIIEEHRPVIEIPRGQIVVGSIIPDDIELYDMPVSARSVRNGLDRYRYFVSPDEKLVLVDPASRMVARIMDRR